jgi:hypothetical protein
MKEGFVKRKVRIGSVMPSVPGLSGWKFFSCKNYPWGILK